MKHIKNTDEVRANELKADEQIKFIDGTFNAEDALEVLLSVINDKINFHSSLLLSNKERFGVDASNSEKRIEELRSEKLSVMELLEEAKSSGALVKINSSINIELLHK
jgi:hypothetical protein